MSDSHQTFVDQLKETEAFLAPDHLAQLKIKYAVNEVALLVIDAQRRFADPKHGGGRGTEKTDAVAKKIQALAPAFRKAGIPIYAIHSSGWSDNPEGIDFHEFKPEPCDMIAGKYDDSAFHGHYVRDLLRKNKRTLLLMCGFNLTGCVRKSARDAKKQGFDVGILRDLSENDLWNSQEDKETEKYLQELGDQGVMMCQSGEVLQTAESLASVREKYIMSLFSAASRCESDTGLLRSRPQPRAASVCLESR